MRKNPAAFADIARKIPQDGGPLEGGDLDFMRKGALGVPALDDALFSMKQGDISDVIRIDGGFQIIKLTGVRGGTVKPFEEVKTQIEDQLKTQEAQKLFTEPTPRSSPTPSTSSPTASTPRPRRSS